MGKYKKNKQIVKGRKNIDVSSNKIIQGFQTVKIFLEDVRVELKKVHWPLRKEVIASTIVVVFLVIFASLFFGVVDISLSKIIELVL